MVAQRKSLWTFLQKPLSRQEKKRADKSMCIIRRPWHSSIFYYRGRRIENLTGSIYTNCTKENRRCWFKGTPPFPNNSVAKLRDMCNWIQKRSLCENRVRHTGGGYVAAAFSIYMTTEDYTKVSYSNLTSHFITKDWILQHSTLGLKNLIPNIMPRTWSMKLSRYWMDMTFLKTAWK